MNRDRGFRIAQKERVIRNRIRQSKEVKDPYIRYVNQLSKKKPFDCGTPGCSCCSRPPSKEKQIAADKAFQEALADVAAEKAFMKDLEDSGCDWADYFDLVG